MTGLILSPRQATEEWEDALLAPAATRSRGAERLAPEPACELRTVFQRDERSMAGMLLI